MAEARTWRDWLFGRRQPTPPQAPPRRSAETLGGGHRGIAAGSVKPGEQDFRPENLARWENLPADVVEAFVYSGQPLYVHSTNVKMARYDAASRQLTVAFKDKNGRAGGVYLYDDVTEDEAVQFAKYQSKGSYVHDVLIGRGNKPGKGHARKPYRRIA